MSSEPGESRGHRDGTLAVHAGLGERRQGDPILAGPTFASPFHLQGDDLEGSPFAYGRYGNPSWSGFERALSALEGEQAQTLVFPSGSAAIAAAAMTVAESGRAVVVPSDGYPTARLVTERLAAMGIEIRAVPTSTEQVIAALPGASLALVESPSNPGLDLVDIEAVATAAEESGARLVVDNTAATPLGQRPLELGAHATVNSGSKHLSGHNDIVLGAFTTARAGWLHEVRDWRTEWGAIAGPFETWLAHRSLATLQVRLERQWENALALAAFLSQRPDVAAVRYPGLPSDPAHELARRQMSCFGTIVCFDLLEAERARRFLEATELLIEATSFGGVHSCAERRERWKIDDVSEGLIRLSVGIEDVRDLREDLERGLAAAAA